VSSADVTGAIHVSIARGSSHIGIGSKMLFILNFCINKSPVSIDLGENTYTATPSHHLTGGGLA